MKRRRFLRDSTIGLAAAGMGGGKLFGALMPEEIRRRATGHSENRPNILVISTDQQYAGAMSCAGNPYLRTPAMDRLARDGTRFELAYCPSPICVPSRASYMTGLMPHQTNVVYNVIAEENPMREEVECLGNLLRKAGYDTGYVGKWHIPRAVEDQEWSGFDFLEAIRNNSVDFDIPGPCIEFIRRKRDKPFLLFASFVNPHDICEFARMLTDIPDKLKNGEIGPTPPAADCPPVVPNHEIPPGEPNAIRAHQFAPEARRTYPSRDWGGREDERWRKYLWAYYRMTELVDSRIETILDTLRESGKEEQTCIVFFSDHGDGIGAHRWNQKLMFYEESARIPFIVSWKGRTCRARVDRNHLVNLGTDLHATLADIAGIQSSGALLGRSVLPYATCPDSADDLPGHEFIVSENNLQPRYNVRGDADGRMVRSRRYKYIRYSRGANSEQLFDLAIDPGEMRSLVESPQHTQILNQHRRMLDRYIRETDDFFPRFFARE